MIIGGGSVDDDDDDEYDSNEEDEVKVDCVGCIDVDARQGLHVLRCWSLRL